MMASCTRCGLQIPHMHAPDGMYLPAPASPVVAPSRQSLPSWAPPMPKWAHLVTWYTP